MIDKIDGIGTEQNQAIRQTTLKMVGEMLDQRAVDAGSNQGAGTAVQELDAQQISDEAIEEIKGKGDNDGANIENLLKGIIEMKSQDKAEGKNEGDPAEDAAAAEAQPQQQQPQQANAANGTEDKKKQEVEEVKVEWSPLMKEGQVVDTGQPWGHFKISREKKEVDADQGDDKKGNPGGPAQAASGAQGAPGAGGAHGAAGSKAVQKNKDVAAIGGQNDIPKGTDGKTPMVQADQNGTAGDKIKEKKDDKMQNVQMETGGKVYIKDEGTGEKQEVPENGELKATHPMKIKNLGQTGELKPGDKLFTYENPSPEELEQAKKAKEQGNNQNDDEEKRKKVQPDGAAKPQ